MARDNRPCKARGHGLGPAYVRGLHEILAAEKDRKIRRKLARINKRRKATIRQSGWLLKMARKLGLKPKPKPAPPISLDKPIAATDHW